MPAERGEDARFWRGRYDGCCEKRDGFWMMSDSERAARNLPKTIGRYEVVDVIGLGAMGAVYKAFDPLIKRTLAIKTLRVDVSRDSEEYQTFIKRFYREARISGALSHSNIVTLFDIGELESGVPFLVMEYVEGETIEALLEKGHPFKPEKVVGLISQVASALDYAHSQQVIHRDIKPSNLILHDGDRMKVTDFGIAKLVGQEMTQAGQLLGTPSYMSPEQAMGEPLDGRSDIFSLGVVAFEMMSGAQPFPGKNVTSILYKLVHADPVEPENLEMNGLVPQKWHEVFGKVLAKKPDERYQSGADFVQDLELCLGSWFGTAMPDELDTSSRPAIPEDTPGDTGATHEIPPATPPAASGDGDSTAVMRGAPEVLPRPDEEESASAPTVAEPAALAPPAQDPDDSLATVAMTGDEMRGLMDSSPGDEMARPADDEAPTLARPAPFEEADESPATVVMPGDEEPVTTEASIPPEALEGGAALPRPADDEVPPTEALIDDEELPPTLAGPAEAFEDDLPPTVSVRASEISSEEPPPTIPVAIPAPDVSKPPPKVREERTVMMDDAQLAQARARIARPAPAAPVVPTETLEPPPRPTPAAPRSSKAVWIGGVSVAAIVALTLAALGIGRLREGAQPPPETTVPAPSEAGVIAVQTRPKGARVSIDGEPRGTTPLEVAGLAPGSYEVEVSLEGHATRHESVVLSDGHPRADLILALLPADAEPGKTPPTTRPPPTPSRPTTGRADFRSTPAGAEVVVDGRSLGASPISGHTLPPGKHSVELRLDGHAPWKGEIEVEAGQTARLQADLEPLPPPTTAAAQVDVDRVYLNTKRYVDKPARKSGGTTPGYPEGAPQLKSGESVSVSVSFIVTREGEVSDLEIVESGGEALDRAVLEAISTWTYEPAEKQGVRVKVKVSIKQTFRAG